MHISVMNGSNFNLNGSAVSFLIKTNDKKYELIIRLSEKIANIIVSFASIIPNYIVCKKYFFIA